MIEGQDMITIPLLFTHPDGQAGVGWATVAPDVSEETKEALRRLMAAAYDRLMAAAYEQYADWPGKK